MKIGDRVKFTNSFISMNIKDKFKEAFRESVTIVGISYSYVMGVPTYKVAFSDGEVFCGVKSHQITTN